MYTAELPKTGVLPIYEKFEKKLLSYIILLKLSIEVPNKIWVKID